MKFVKIENNYTPEVALEGIFSAAGQSMRNMISYVAEYFPSLRQAFTTPSESIKNLVGFSKDGAFTSLRNNLTGFTDKENISASDFQDFTNVNITIPESFTGNLYEYSEFLDRSWKFLHANVFPQLDLFYASLASFASNKEAKILLKDTSKVYDTLESEYDSLSKEATTYFGKVLHNSSTGKLGSAFSDMDQYRNCSKTALRLVEELSNDDIKQINVKLEKIVSVLDTIIEEAKAGNYDRASFESVKSLAKGTYSLARVIEFYPVTYYRVKDLAFSMNENRKVVSDLM